jgi:LAO/AO transport system kinase
LRGGYQRKPTTFIGDQLGMGNEMRKSVRGIIAEVSELASTEHSEVAQMMARLRAGDVRALARAVSMVEDRTTLGAELAEACRRSPRRSLRVGVTGPPGAGKSTLVDQMVRWLRADGQSVGVVAVDPSSPYTGGALLGDRIRMQGFAEDAGVYIRSMASRGATGGITRAAADVCSVLEAAGRQTVVIETVGVGQDEVEVIGLADVTVLVLVPGMGDEVQSLKAGVMEIADVYVVNKADRGGAEQVEQEIIAMQSLGEHANAVSVVRTVASTRRGGADGGGSALCVAEGEQQDAVVRRLFRTRRAAVGPSGCCGEEYPGSARIL